MRLRLVTLNTWALPWRLSFDVEHRMQAIGQALIRLRPDVVTLQELWSRGASRLLMRELSRGGLSHQWIEGIGLGNGGLALASRYPIAQARFTPFQVQGRPEKVRHGDYYGGKGYVQAALVLDRRRVTVFNTHLHSRHVSSAPHRYSAERTAQAVELAAAVERATSPGVVAGDFNMSPGGAVYETFRLLSGCHDAALDVGAPSPTHFHRASGRRERLDYVFIRNGERVGLAIAGCATALDEEIIAGLPVRRYSDHAALAVDFETPAAASRRLPDDLSKRKAVAAATAVLREARRELVGRQRRMRVGAAVGVGLLAGGVMAPRMIERRTFLKAASYSVGGLAAMTSGGLLALSEYGAQRDLDGLDRVLELLRSI